jgi:glucan endo-1,3-alpha-glucosidase
MLTHDKAGILVAAGQTGLKAIVISGSTTLGTQTLVPGFNGFSFLGMTTGNVSVSVVNSAGATVISGTGPITVSRGLSHVVNFADGL